MKRDTGKAVEGHVEASSEDVAYEVLSDHGIVTESLRPDPRPTPAPPPDPTPPPPRSERRGSSRPERRKRPRDPEADMDADAGAPDAADPVARRAWDIADAIESAFDTSAQQVAVDKLAERFRGQRVWVIDRDKIRKRVMQIVEQAIAQGTAKQESHEQVRDRIATAVEKLFEDNRNLTSQAPAPQAAGDGQQATPTQQAPPQPPPAEQPQAAAVPASDALDKQIERLSRVVEGMERAVGNLTNALRSGITAGGPARFSHESRQTNEAQEAALLEIFEDNLELRRQVDAASDPTGNGEPAAGSET